jgi:hypothetical protein
LRLVGVRQNRHPVATTARTASTVRRSSVIRDAAAAGSLSTLLINRVASRHSSGATTDQAA